jgi:hypothetical protein
VIDGAEILKNTPEIPTLAPIVAFEHHLRSDGTGYPIGISRPKLNLGTTLCGIADVFDAMRSQRVYQEAHPTDRILAVLQRNDGKQFTRTWWPSSAVESPAGNLGASGRRDRCGAQSLCSDHPAAGQGSGRP